MTMTRTKKAEHSSQLVTAITTGHCIEEFASPKLYLAAKAERGHARMTSREYREHRMGRRPQMPESMLEMTIALRGRLHRQQRTLGGRRIHGLRRGYRNISYDVQRALRIR